MPRCSRELTQTGIYHVMLRGNERKEIFLDDEDKQRIIETLLLKRKDNGFKIYAFCVMDNHLHLLIKETKDSLSRILKRVGTSYAYYYNKKHKRVGHVFQDRFKSEAVNNDGQLLEVVRYIHNNPVKADIVKRAREYKWSSFKYYLMNNGTDFISKALAEDVKEILGMFSEQLPKAIESFKRFNKERTEEKFLDDDYIEKEKKDDLIQDRIAVVLESKGTSIEMIRNNREVRDDVIRELKYQQGISVRKIAEFLEVDRNIVQRVRSETK